MKELFLYLNGIRPMSPALIERISKLLKLQFFKGHADYCFDLFNQHGICSPFTDQVMIVIGRTGLFNHVYT